MPSGPRSVSMNSRTSRPRSPTRARTTTSHVVPSVSIDSRVDLPTPEPVADGCQAGQALDLDHQAEKVGDGAADMGWLHAFQARLARIDPLSEIVVCY